MVTHTPSIPAESCHACGMEGEAQLLQPTSPNPQLADYQKRFWAMLPLGLIVFLLAMGEMLPPLSTWAEKPAFNWLQMILATPVVLWGGWPFLKKGFYSLQTRQFNMFTLIGLGITIDYLYSVVATVFPNLFPASYRTGTARVAVYFEAASVITLLVLLGQILEQKASSKTRTAIAALLDLKPKKALLITPNGEEHEIAVEDIQAGQRLRIRPGEAIAVDGQIIEGRSTLDESMLTGEALAIDKGPGDPIIGGTVNQTGSLVIEAKAVGEKTVLAQIIRLVAQAQSSRAPIQRLADRVAAFFVPLVLSIAGLSFLGWLIFGPQPSLTFAIVNAVAVLIIACPCVLGLVTPLSIMVGTGRGAQMGILVKNAEVLETFETIDTLVIDKTGTLTEGKPQLKKILTFDSLDKKTILEKAASLEAASEHPIGRAIVEAAKTQAIKFAPAQNVQTHPGQGISGKVGRDQILLGTASFLDQQDISTAAFTSQVKGNSHPGETLIFLAINQKPAGFLSLSDALKSTSRKALKTLKKKGIHIIMATGDRSAVAQHLAQDLDIDAIHAEILPAEKAQLIQDLQNQGHRVAMAGDGINDAPALAQADIGIAMGGGTDIAMETADMTLIHGDLLALTRAHSLSSAIMRNIRQNLTFAFGYNALGIPIAAGVAYPIWGLLLNPMIASAAMSLSCLCIISNALRLKKMAV